MSLLVLAQTTTQVWDGMTVVQQTAPVTGTSNLLRDAATGDVAIQTGTLLGGGTKWGLTDRLGSTIGQTSGSKVGQIAKYSDWGVPTFATAGWTSKTGYTGELGDATTGLNLFYARAYEPMSGGWLSADPYRGTYSDPGTLGRYNYVGGNPTTFSDLYGYVTGSKNLGGGHELTKMKGAYPTVGNSPPGVHTPSSNTSRNSARHDDSFWGTFWDNFNKSLQSQVNLGVNIVGGVFDATVGLVKSMLDVSPVTWAIKTLVNPNWFTEENSARAAVILQLAHDPNAAATIATGIGTAFFGYDEWGTNPGHAIGTSLVTIATFALPAGAAIKGTKAGEAAVAGELAVSNMGAGSTSLFRSVSSAELADITDTGLFRASEGSMEGKFFTDSYENAAQWGRQLDGSATKIVTTRVPTDLVRQAEEFQNLDGIGTGYYFGPEMLDELNRVQSGTGVGTR